MRYRKNSVRVETRVHAEPTAIRSVHSGYGGGIKKRVRRRNSGRGKPILYISIRRRHHSNSKGRRSTKKHDEKIREVFRRKETDIKCRKIKSNGFRQAKKEKRRKGMDVERGED